MADDKGEAARKAVTQAIAASAICRATVQRLIDRAYDQFNHKQITVAQYNQVDAECRKALQAAAAIVDAATRGLSSDLAVGLAQIGAATDELKAAADKIEKAQDVVTLSCSLLVSVLAIAAAVMDPTRASAVAALGAIKSTVEEIVRQAAAKKDDADALGDSDEDAADDPKGNP